jgi:hypothetical protein
MARWAHFAILPAILFAMPQGGRTAAAPPEDRSSAPTGWIDQVQRDLKEREYELTWQAEPAVEGIEPSWHAPNRSQGFRTYFTSEGIRVVPRTEAAPTWRWGLSLVGYGNAEKTWEVPRPNLEASGHRMEYHHGALEEFYVNTSDGLEQGFNLPAPPGSSGAGGATPELQGWGAPLRRPSAPGHGVEVGNGGVHVDLALWGDLAPRISEDGQAIDFLTPTGAPVLHYAQLKVTDARGSTLPSWMEGFAGEGVRGIRIVMDTRQAVYPVTIDPLSTAWAWTAVSNQDNALFGSSVATAGDVNGDGFSDVILGAPAFDNGLTDEGRAYVYLGSASGLSTIAAWTAESDLAGAQFGISVSTAGDVNGDGYSDVIVGAYLYSNGQTNEGRAFVYHGSASGLSLSPSWTGESNQAGSWFGYSVSVAGDVNGDGFSDVIVGAYNFTNGQSGEGRAFVYHGSSSGLSLTASWTAESDQVSALFGNSVSTAGDVNGDGYSDVIVGAYSFDNGETNEGRAYIYNGSASGLSPAFSWTAESDQAQALFGNSVSTAGDVNGDGYSDVIVGAHLFDNGQLSEGRAWVYHGSASGPSTTASWMAEGDLGGARFGYSVGTAGDVNGDGYADVIIGANLYSNPETNEGRAFVYNGSEAGLSSTASWTAESDQAGAQFASSVGSAGDINGDGYSDVVVGAPNYDEPQIDEGRVFVYIGSASGPALFNGWVADGGQSNAFLGSSVTAAGDVNGDGYADVIVGADNYDNGQDNEGRAYVYLGSASGISSSPAWTAESDQFGALYGFSVGTAGDVNGDGYADVIVGAPGYTTIQISEGRIYVYHGSASGLSPIPAWIYDGVDIEGQVGISVGTAGDVNGDGLSDVIIGGWSPRGEHPESQYPPFNMAIVFLGSPTGVSSLSTSLGGGQQMGGRFGSSVGAAGDVNGDGYSDVIVGSYQYDNGESDEGRAFVYLGSGSGVTSGPAWTAESNQVDAHFGYSVGTAGDVNGDGYSDVIVGAPNYSAGQAGEGRVYVYLGSASGLAVSPAWLADGELTGAGYGYSVATAGDVNGDGFADIILGAPSYTHVGPNDGRAAVYLGSVSGLSLFPAWVRNSQDGSRFGTSVATAGDVNADGYAEIIVGAPAYDATQLDEGRAFVYYGNGGAGTSVRPQQRRSDISVPIAPLGRSNAPNFRLAALGRTPFGRGRVKLEWEIKPLGTPFNGLGTQQSAAPIDTGTDGTGIDELVTGLGPGVHHWRIRFRYGTAATPFAQSSRWLTVPWNGWQEADLRSGAFVGGFAWDDLDGDGIREAGEPGHAGVLVSLYSGGSTIVAEKTTLADGTYDIAVPGTGPYQLLFTSPSGYTYTVPKQGGDDLLDSDVDQMIGLTVPIGPTFTAADASRWSAGLISCPGPMLPLFITGARFAPGTSNVILDFTDPNQPGTTTGATGYNSYRSTQPQPPPPPWMGLAGDTQDEDPGIPNIQLTDWTGDNLPVGSVFYYQVQAYNHVCGTEGPR